MFHFVVSKPFFLLEMIRIDFKILFLFRKKRNFPCPLLVLCSLLVIFPEIFMWNRLHHIPFIFGKDVLNSISISCKFSLFFILVPQVLVLVVSAGNTGYHKLSQTETFIDNKSQPQSQYPDHPRKIKEATGGFLNNHFINLLPFFISTFWT